MATDDTRRDTATAAPESPTMDFETERVAGIALGPDEEVLHDVRPSYWNWPLWTLSIFGMIYPILLRYQIRYLITTDRVIAKRGWMTTETTEVYHEDIRQIRCEKDVIEKFTRNGTIQLDTAHNEQIELNGISRQSAVANTIRERRSVV